MKKRGNRNFFHGVCCKRLLPALAILLLFSLPVLASEKSSEPIILDALGSGKPTFVDFGAKYCFPCKMMRSTINELQTEYRERANIIYVDINEERHLADKYKVRMIPTQIFFDAKGKEIERHVGFITKGSITSILRKATADQLVVSSVK